MKKNIRVNMGITVISLIIMMIVLIILATVAISGIVGDQSIIKRTTDVAEKTDLEQAKEMVLIIVNRSYDSSGNLSFSKLKQEVEAEGLQVPVSNTNFPLTCTYKNLTITIDQYGEITCE